MNKLTNQKKKKSLKDQMFSLWYKLYRYYIEAPPLSLGDGILNKI